ncbi:MAG: ATP-dependent DNA ligase [Steroidobacteraceae bacterium]|nr:ATP-dependent DNA ligase [Steroidobacteraceae bacterium]
MRDFAELYDEIDTTTSTNLKVDAMARYFRTAPPADAAWAAYILSGRRLKRFIGPALLWRWLIEASGLPEWLVSESCSAVGDIAEAIALLMETAEATKVATDVPLADWIEQRLLPLREAEEAQQREAIITWWRTLPYRECFLLNKLLTGELRVGVSELLVTRALADVFGMPRTELARRFMGEWRPSAAFWQALRSGEAPVQEASAPYPFYLASPLDADVQTLGAPEDWQIEWKWDGIRGQLIRRAGQCFIWSRGEDVVTERFPEVVDAAMEWLPDGVVLDGELVAWREGSVQPFAQLQQRIGRKKLTAAILESVPVRFVAYDLLEDDHADLRGKPLQERRARLEALLAGAPEVLAVSPLVTAACWDELAKLREESRARSVEGLMLKQKASPYGTGRQRGAWWKWKIDPYSFDAVMLYAQPGHGRRSNLYTDYTFGVWNNGELVPVAKAYSGLSNEEIAELDRWIRSHTLEKFGPVRAVEPSQVFELAYEGIAASRRHKSGIALRFPRILRWRTDKPAQEADTLRNLQAVLDQHRGRKEPN